MSERRNGRWAAVLAVAVLVAACSGSADSESTVPPTQPSTTQPGDADQSARILELEQAVGALTEELATVREDLAGARADVDSLDGRVAGLTSRLADLQLGFDSWQDYVYSWAQPQFIQYQLELELLRPLIPLPDTPEARRGLETLEAFLAAVHDGDFRTAAILYGGSYESLVDWNPLVDPSDAPALFEAACTHQLRCELAVRRVLAGPIQPDEYTFYVEFQTDDGEPWTMGPCCGSETDPTVSQFPFIVSRTAAGWRVLTPPIYTP
ncbi:MAG TPA: hypothetical protein VLS92_08110 [Acidimicrobiia bacterium]|nr:hypothetical protein [Acidimicrobiia bacterium]